MFLFKKSELSTILSDHFFLFLALGLLIVGSLGFEDKILLYGIPWTWFAILSGWFFIFAFRLLDYKKSLLIIKFFTLLVAIIIFVLINYIFFIDGAINYGHLSHHLSTLFITSCTVFIIASKLDLEKFFIITDRFCLIICFALLIARIITFDFGREGTFLGLGPLTFIKYISLGVLVRVLFIKKLSLIPIFLYGFAFFVANSRGPTLFLLLSIFGWLIFHSKFSRSFFAIPALALILFLLSFNTRMNSFIEEIQVIPSVLDNISIEDSEIYSESISGTIARAYSLKLSWDMIKEDPIFGIGPGQWPKITGLESMKYPHNSVMEIWSEYGLLPVLIFIFVILSVIREFFKKNPFSILAIFAFMTTLTSGSIRDLRFLAFLILMTLFYKYLVERRTRINEI